MDKQVYFSQRPIELLKAGPASPSTSSSEKTSSVSFGKILEQQVAKPLKFSNHAMERLKSRNILLNESDLSKLQAAIDQARQKGSRDSLVLMKDLALVVSVKNNTVITAVDGQNLKDNVFTNIDSAVIV